LFCCSILYWIRWSICCSILCSIHWWICCSFCYSNRWCVTRCLISAGKVSTPPTERRTGGARGAHWSARQEKMLPRPACCDRVAAHWWLPVLNDVNELLGRLRVFFLISVRLWGCGVTRHMDLKYDLLDACIGWIGQFISNDSVNFLAIWKSQVCVHLCEDFVVNSLKLSDWLQVCIFLLQVLF
jgi:hypothetical protein